MRQLYISHTVSQVQVSKSNLYPRKLNFSKINNNSNVRFYFTRNILNNINDSGNSKYINKYKSLY